MLTSSSTIAYSPITTWGPICASGCTRAVGETVAEGSTGISLYDTGVVGLSVAEIADRLKADWEGEGGVEIAGVAPLELAGPADVSFVGNRKAAAAAGKWRPGCPLVTKAFPHDRALLPPSPPRRASSRPVAL